MKKLQDVGEYGSGSHLSARAWSLHNERCARVPIRREGEDIVASLRKSEWMMRRNLDEAQRFRDREEQSEEE